MGSVVSNFLPLRVMEPVSPLRITLVSFSGLPVTQSDGASGGKPGAGALPFSPWQLAQAVAEYICLPLRKLWRCSPVSPWPDFLVMVVVCVLLALVMSLASFWSMFLLMVIVFDDAFDVPVRYASCRNGVFGNRLIVLSAAARDAFVLMVPRAWRYELDACGLTFSGVMIASVCSGDGVRWASSRADVWSGVSVDLSAD